MRLLLVLVILVLSGCWGYSQKLPADTSYPLCLQFVSHCCGVPSEAPVKEYIDSFKLNQHIPEIKAIHIGPLGREGEYRIVFTLNELNDTQKAAFISGLKNVRKQGDDPGDIHILTDERINMQEFPKRTKQTEISF